MDRRTVSAFVLIFLIIMGYPYLMKKFYGTPTPVETSREETSPATGPETAGQDQAKEQAGGPVEAPRASSGERVDAGAELPSSTRPATAAEALAWVDQGPEQVLRVESPLYTMDISTRGGRVAQWQGHKFKSWKGGFVRLVPDSIPADGNEVLKFRAADLDLGSVVYRADRQSLQLNEHGGPASLVLSARTAGGLVVKKIFTFHPEDYGVQVDFVLATDGPAARQALAMTGEPEGFRFGWNQGIAPTERVQKMEARSLRSMAKIGEDLHYKRLAGLKKNVEKVKGQWRGSVHFAGLQDRYFTVVGIVPQEQGEPVEGVIRLGGDPDFQVQTWTIEVPAQRGVGDEIAMARLDLYIGPQEADLLRAYGQGLDETMDLGWTLFRPLAKVVLWGMKLMHRYISNYGWIIIIFSVVTKLAFYPLTKSSTQSMKKMQELQPKMKALQEKYKDDKEKLNQATMKLYQEEKVNPLAGCLPLLVQSPVFIALYQALNHSIALRGQPFMGWITDLSQPDAITTLPFALPVLGTDLNVLPLLMAVAMYFQTKLTPSSGGGQMAAMNTMMPLFMVFIFYNMPSGLVLYYLINTVMQAYQTWRIHQTAPDSGGKQTA